MTANQPNARQFNPNSLNLCEVATYDRLIRAPLERVWENVLDWEHLPYLHETSFDYVELDAGGDWGWRTWSNAEHSGHVELTVANDDSYVARSYLGEHQISEIWTTLTKEDDNTRVHVSFHLPDIAPDDVEKMGNLMLGLYTTLWDEDEAMMRERHDRLTESRDLQTQCDLGSEADIREQLSKGDEIRFQLKRREFQLRLDDDKLVAHATICPHLLGPLSKSTLSEGRLRCPWHGYEFDIDSGECVFPESASCKLPASPTLHVSNGNLIASSS